MMDACLLPDHRVSIAGLRALLSQLRDDDVIAPNGGKNFAILRGTDYIGCIHLSEGRPRLELFVQAARAPVRRRLHILRFR